MARRSSRPLLAPAALAVALLGGCFDEPPLPASGLPVFTDAFTPGFTPNPFDTSVTTSLKVDTATVRTGAAAIRLDVPSAAAGYSGGAVLAATPQDLSSCNALVFWAKASAAATLDRIGYGMEFPDRNPYKSAVNGINLTTEWTPHVVPIPDPSRLTATKGVLWWVERETSGYTAWLDDVRFDRVDAAALALRPAVVAGTTTLPVASSEAIALSLAYTDLDGTARSLDVEAPGSGPARAFFSFTSSAPSVATVDASGIVTAVAPGQARVTARLAGLEAEGVVTVTVVASAPTAPADAAPAPPARAAADVASLFTSGAAYTSVPVDSWQASWSAAGPASTYTIPGTTRAVKKYTAMKYAGVELLTSHANVAAMTTLHLDLWTPDATTLTVKLVGFNGATAGAEAAAGFAVKRWRWVSLDVPLSAFAGVDLANVGQIVWVTNPGSEQTGTFFIDNVYFYR